MMPALVGDDPDASTDTTLESPVERPRQKMERIRELGDECDGKITQDGGDGNVRENIGEGSGYGTIEAVRWYGFL